MAFRRLVLVLPLCMALAGCEGAAKESASAPAQRPLESDFNPVPFLREGFKVVRVARGDLNGDSLADAVIVAMPDETDPEARFARRMLSIVVASPNGTFSLVSQNTMLAGCEVCGGSMGDGLAEVSISDGALTVANEGGIRAGWSDVYTFRYEVAINDWALVNYRSLVSSQVDQQSGLIESTPEDFGVMRFAELKQDDLPRATLP
jgi:hypothetical protein